VLAVEKLDRSCILEMDRRDGRIVRVGFQAGIFSIGPSGEERESREKEGLSKFGEYTPAIFLGRIRFGPSPLYGFFLK
jgi:hypothetical protein